MVAGSVLPVTICDGKLLFLFGKECSLENSARGWSDFGGGCEDCKESDSFRVRTRKVFDTAVREGVEETTGFLGTQTSIRRKLIRANNTKDNKRATSRRTGRANGTKGPANFVSLTHNTYTTFFMPIEYDEKLPIQYNDNHRLIWNNLNRKYLNTTKMFEKIEVEWFSEEDMRRRRAEFRGFYRDIVDRILEKIDNERTSFVSFVKKGIPKVQRRNRTCKSRKA